MAAYKSNVREQYSIRLRTDVKNAVQEIALERNRSLSNIIELIMIEWLKAHDKLQEKAV